MNSEKIVHQYFATIRARDIDGLTALYADDATFVLPNGKEFTGVAAIRAMHLGVFAASSPSPSPINMVITDTAVAVEIEAHLPDGAIRRTANFYQLTNDGRIQRISVYMRAIT